MGRGWPCWIGSAAEHCLRGTNALSVGRAVRCGAGGCRCDGLSHPVGTPRIAHRAPELPVHLRLDGTLLRVSWCCSAPHPTGISIFAAGYFRRGEGTAPGLLCLQYHLFLASMGFVLLADDAYAFMLAWETMALSSYFLVTTQHRIPEIRHAGFLYLLMAHLGAIAILLGFGVLQGGSWHFTFDAMRAAHLGTHWATAAFCLALIGFGAKAGLVPLHVWLPEAHPAAPSPVSALMSGVMLKTALYGMIRVSFDLLGQPIWWWGLVPLSLGLFSALYGVVFAAAQTDMKRLLAYSSIENIGILFTGLGLAIVFAGVGYARRIRTHVDCRHVSRHESRVHEEPVVLGHRGGTARNRRAQPRAPGRPHSSNAVGGVADAHRRTGHCRTAALEWVRIGMAAASVLSILLQGTAPLHQHAVAARGGVARAGRRACRLCHGQILWRHLSGAAARTLPATRPRCWICRTPRTRLARARLRAARLFPRQCHLAAQPRHAGARFGWTAGRRCAVVAAGTYP